MKKVISLVLAISMIFSLSVSSLAKETDPSPINDPYLPNVIVVENGIPKRITQVEYDQIKKESQLALNEKATAESISTDNEISPRLITFYDYTEESYLYYFDTSQKTPVTPVLKQVMNPEKLILVNRTDLVLLLVFP